MARPTKFPLKLDGWLVFALATMPIAADADQLMITGWKRPIIFLRASPEGAEVQRPSNDLPSSVAVTGREGEFLRFTDPRSGTSWLVPRLEVTTNQPEAPAPQTLKLTPPCPKFGPEGMKACR